MERLRGTCISIHASAREATTCGVGNLKWFHDFNPRLREGGDDACLTLLNSVFISIHASAREATIVLQEMKQEPCYFNPRLRKGGDVIAAVMIACISISIHASAREATMSCSKDSSNSIVYFNPRLRKGGDCINYQFLHLIQSIPCIDHPSGTSN